MNRIRLLLATLQIEVNHILIEFFCNLSHFEFLFCNLQSYEFLKNNSFIPLQN